MDTTRAAAALEAFSLWAEQFDFPGDHQLVLFSDGSGRVLIGKDPLFTFGDFDELLSEISRRIQMNGRELRRADYNITKE